MRKTREKLNDEDERFMRMALVEAEYALQEKEIPVGAIVVCQGKVIAKAHNQTLKLNDPTAHAEMLAITSAAHHLSSRYLNECTLYVTLEPCPMCAGASAWALMGRIVYGAADEQRGYRHFSEKIAHAKTQVTGGVLAEPCEALLKQFFASIRAK
jgi:tRNA(adenine34) deaminase